MNPTDTPVATNEEEVKKKTFTELLNEEAEALRTKIAEEKEAGNDTGTLESDLEDIEERLSNPVNRDSIYHLDDEEQAKFLRKKKSLSVELTELNDPEFLERIYNTVKFVGNPANNAAGLASRQIGCLYSWFVTRWGRAQRVVAIINPFIIGRNGRKQHEEGCFSEPFRVRIKRSKEITVRGTILTFDKDGNIQHTETLDKNVLSGRDAQVFQHEYDHLVGKLITDKGTRIK